MKTALWAAALLALGAALVCAAEPAAPAVPPAPPLDLSQQFADFEHNSTLGAALSMRAGTPAELKEVADLAERGLKQARDAVASHPDSADAQYLLGSWLLYGYRVVEVRSITFPPTAGEQSQLTSKVLQGLADDPQEGLAALKRAADLAPTRAGYFLDYAAALADYDRIPEATELLKAAWAGKPPLTTEEKIYAAVLLSDIAAYQGRLEEAREWIYAALALTEPGARAVERLRSLDWVQAQAAEAAAAEPLPEEAPHEPAAEQSQQQPEPQQYEEQQQYPSEEYYEEQSEPETYEEEYQPEDYGAGAYEDQPDIQYFPPDVDYAVPADPQPPADPCADQYP